MQNLKEIEKDITEEIFACDASKHPLLIYFEYDEIEVIVHLVFEKLKERGLLEAD